MGRTRGREKRVGAAGKGLARARWVPKEGKEKRKVQRPRTKIEGQISGFSFVGNDYGLAVQRLGRSEARPACQTDQQPSVKILKIHICPI